MRKLVLSAFLICGGANPAQAGRPVFQDLTLAELVGRSDLVAVVAKRKPFKASARKLEGSCEELSWPFRIKEVLSRQATGSPAAAHRPLSEESKTGQKINVVFNQVALEDCRHRLGNKSGASFAAERYAPTDPDVLEKAAELIVFLRAGDGGYSLAALNAFESVALKKAVLELTGGAPARPESRR